LSSDINSSVYFISEAVNVKSAFVAGFTSFTLTWPVNGRSCDEIESNCEEYCRQYGEI